ncbi:hypothetical protein ABZY02_23680 [Streptomyces sp. NPDC006649]|uniref:hypothetical protein n=1 Tax=Streptomyces sp. NPDC006649 TaxID=3156896 RepID=UPI0033A0129E
MSPFSRPRSTRVSRSVSVMSSGALADFEAYAECIDCGWRTPTRKCFRDVKAAAQRHRCRR